MKKNFLRMVLAVLFALSVGVAGGVFAEVALANPAPLAACPSCGGDGICAGSTCNCVFDGGTAFHCAPPVK